MLTSCSIPGAVAHVVRASVKSHCSSFMYSKPNCIRAPTSASATFPILPAFNAVPLSHQQARKVAMASATGAAASTDPLLPTSSGPKDVEHGFQRPEMYSAKLVGSVREYNVHVFAVVDKDVMEWPKNVEAPEFSLLSSKLGEALKARKKDIPMKVKYTIVQGEADGDVLVLPNMIKYPGLSADAAEQFVEEALVGTPEKKLAAEALEGDHLFVCAHNSHDTRCGVCGLALVEVLREEIKRRGLKTSVWPCSHIGGHKFAGNVIAYTRRPDGSVAGDWYGYVTPGDVPTLLDAFKAGEVVDPLWRGGINLDGAAQEAAQAARKEACACAAGTRSATWSLPAQWDPSTKVALAATLAAAVAIGAAWYLRSRAASAP